jgi:tRNA (cytidine/uridine-2'-O-)-methyltransferase
MHIVLFQPQIPHNTGNIARTCFLTGSGLVLVRPLGFSVSDRALKRAGLDYWKEMSIEYCDDLENYLIKKSKPFYFFSSRALKKYTEIPYSQEDLLIFGSETAGIPEVFWGRWKDHFYTIPMRKEGRCLNLSNAAAIVLYEALRQKNFSSL